MKLKDGSKVDEDELKRTGSLGVLKVGDNVQVIYGPKVSTIRTEFEEYLETAK